ncbi:MAG: copper-binding protein [Nitrosomonadales bacterium]|nr:copper-binding protein [Nitrosomonadales bacterium]
MQNKTGQNIHQGTGKVVSIDRAKLRIKLAHNPIDSLSWTSMEMEFSIANAALLSNLKSGDAVRFELRHLKPDELVWGIARIEHLKLPLTQQ